MRYFMIGLTYMACLYFFTGAGEFPEKSQYFPRGAAILLFILNSLYLGSILKGSDGSGKDTEAARATKRFFVCLLAGVLYVLALDYAGVLLATPVFLTVMMRYLGCVNPKTLGLVAVGITTSIYIVFQVIFQIPLPVGILL